MKNIICIISGPTASGKTSTSIKLAKKFGGVIINFDSLVFYNEISIGTAKPTLEEQDGVEHYFVGSHSIANPINAADFIKEVIPLINKLHQDNQIVYLVGGSGFYLQAILYGMYDSVTTPLAITEKSNRVYSEQGILPFINFLKEHDPESFHQYHENDHYRIRRAVEHFWTSNTKFSDSRNGMDKKKENSPWNKFHWNVFHAYLDLPKDEHFSIIQNRTKQMLSDGLLKEVDDLITQGFTGVEKPLKSIGYKECFDYKNGLLQNEEELVERIDISTRQLAKSQRTWFKKVEKNQYHPINEQEALFSDFAKYINTL